MKLWVYASVCALGMAPGFLTTSGHCAAPRYRITDLGDLPGGVDNSFGSDVNAFGQVTGSSAVGEAHAFLWTPTVRNGTSGSMIDLGTLQGVTQSIGNAINDYGQVVGHSVDQAGAHPF